MSKKILIPNGSFHDIPLIKKAKEMGFYVVTSGSAPEGKGHPFADEYVYGDFSDQEKMLEIAREKEVDFVCSNCNDFGYLSACYVAEKLGLGGHEPYEAARALHRKDEFKKLARIFSLSSPAAKSFETMDEVESWIPNVEFPVIVKPVDLGAGQGVHRADSVEEVLGAAADAFSRSKCKKVVVEPFVKGTSHSFNAFIVDKKVASYYSDNEYMKYSSYRVSTSVGPADYIEEAEAILIRDTEKVAEALDLPDGLVHSQYILDECHTPHILEMTRRMSGDWYPYPEGKATGIDWVEYIVRAQCGMDCSDFPRNVGQRGFTGRHCLNGPRPGKVREVLLHPKLKEHVYDAAMWLEDGFEIKNVEKDYPGILFFSFRDKEEMEEIIGHIEEYIQFVYQM